jgi:hypothetical protein
MTPMVTVKPMASEKVPMPNPVMIGTAWIQMIENADFVPETPKSQGTTGDPKKAPESEGTGTPVVIHQAAAVPVTRTKVTMHNGAELFIEGSVLELAGMMG